MPQKRKRAWLVEDSRAHGRIKKQAEARKQREAYKLERTRALVEQGLTKYQLDERRDRYYCMKEHPARFCGQCNPRADVEDNEGLSDEEAGMSDSWSDGTASDDYNHRSNILSFGTMEMREIKSSNTSRARSKL